MLGFVGQDSTVQPKLALNLQWLQAPASASECWDYKHGKLRLLLPIFELSLLSSFKAVVGHCHLKIRSFTLVRVSPGTVTYFIFCHVGALLVVLYLNT